MIQEAIRHYKHGITHDIFKEPVTTYAKLAIESMEEVEQYRALGTVEELKEAREKQIPKKPTVGDFMNFYHCPNCGEHFDCDEEYYLENGEWHYCGKCGQKLDWSEEDD